jgi:hypothetical protein
MLTPRLTTVCSRTTVEEGLLRGIWEEGDDRGFVLEALRDGVEVRAGRP